MASCKRQQCIIDRLGFRQELDSWRHKLIHCVGFESILEGLFGQELIEDLKLFKDLEPLAVSDWSFDENCLFCCLQRDRVKEHLIGLNEGFEGTTKPLLVKDQISINRLEKQAEEFLSAVLSRNDVPNFSDPHIPVVVREILQRMIRQFAAEYTSKASSPQDSRSDSQHSDQSLPTPPLLSGAPPTSPAATVAGPAHNQNPVLSKLLMADQDAPLDLTIKKYLAEPKEQDGVLDLSIKKNRNSSSLPVHSSCLSPAASMLKGRSLRADGQVGLFMKSLQDGRRRENFSHSTCYRPSSSLAYSLHIKEEADLESDPESPLSHKHSSSPTDLFRNASASWNSKSHFGALLKLKTSSEATEHLKDLPKLLEAAGLLTKSLAREKGNLQEACRDPSLSYSSSIDLKIPQVRVLATGTDPSWDSSDYSGSLCENGMGAKPCSILPRQIQKKSNGGFNVSGSDKEYWSFPTHRQALGGNYPMDSEPDLGNKQPRKKRGRYRQYNTELLEEAIVVVMGGKMSVSKAQSVYGIPHSTLEYKVKERLGTLKHPPKKKLKLMSQVQEQTVSQSPKSEQPQNLQDTVSESQESACEEINNVCDGILLPTNESPDLRVVKAKDLQSTSTLEQFMAKLCPHHQRQIVDAISFLQTEVKALSNTPKASTGVQGAACSAVKSGTVTPEKSCSERIPSESTPKSEVQDVSHSIPSSNTKQGPGNAASLKTSVPGSPALDLRSPGSGSYQVLVAPSGSPKDADNNRHSDHAPLKMKILTSNTDGKKLACVLNTSLCAQSDTLAVRQSISNSSNRTDTQSARLSSSVKRHNQISQTHETMQSETPKHAKDSPAKVVHVTIPSDSVRTARKTTRASSEQRTRDSTVFRGMVDPDLGHCDIVFIDKPITECFKEKRRGMQPRRNARKSTRGHMYSDEVWELKTVRTLAGRGNCPNPMPELITLVTPKQILSKHEGVPPVDMPFAGACRETMNQQKPTEETGDSVIPETGDIVEVAASKVDVIVETSQTDQCQSNRKSCPPSPLTCPAVNTDSVSNIEEEEDAVVDSGITAEGEEIAGQAPLEAVRNNDAEHQQDPHEHTEQMMSETVVEPLNDVTIEDAEPKLPSDEQHNNEAVQLQNSASLLVNQVEEKMEEDKREELQDEQPEDPQIQNDLTEVTEKANITGTEEEPVVEETEIKTSEADDSVTSLETEGGSDDVSSKTLEMLLKELPPWRTKKGSQILLPKRCRQTETVVGYFNGRPILGSDRSLRRRANNSNMSPGKTVKCSLNAPNSTSVDPVAESKGSQTLPNTNIPVKSKETTSVVQQVTDSSSDTPSSPVSKFPSRTKQIQKQKRVQDSLSPLSDRPGDCLQNTESKRQLRSTRQNVSLTPVTPPTSDAGFSISSPKPTTAILPSTIEEVPALPFSYSHPITTSPQVRSPEPTVFEQPQQNMVPETVELNVENTQSPDLPPNETQKNEVDVRLWAKPILRRSSKVLANDEKQQPCSESSCPVESISTVKTEMQTQIMPLRNKRVLQKKAESEASEVTLQQKSNVASLEDRSANGDNSSSSISDRPTRMPLRRESIKAEMALQAVTQSQTVDNKKLALRQRLAGPSTSALTVATRQNDNTSPVRIMPERMTKSQMRSPSVPVASVSHSSPTPTMTPRQEPKQMTNRFVETLTGEESQQLITNLNIKYDKMQKGWVQMDKEGQPAAKYRNKSDRQAAIWKSKRRARKPKSVEHQKYSPVQMLFMKGFDLSSICRWFLESTETKSLVIVKKMNTRLPSETQLCFHSSSSSSATSQGVFPSLQAERLKKHLKKFAIASPVKSNPKSQKLIARALEQEANPVKGKERGEIPNATQTLAKSYSSRKASAQIGESQKTSGKSRNPASARILRKYSNIREKMQVHQTTKRLKEASKILKTNNMKRLATTKPVAKSNLRPALKERKSAPPVSKQIKTSATKMERRKAMAEKKSANDIVQGRAVKAQSSSKASNLTCKNELPKRSSQRLGFLKISEIKNPADSPKSKVDSKKHIEAEKVEVDKPAVTNINSGESVCEIPHQSMEAKAPTSHDQVLTRSQRKMEAAVPVSRSPSAASKKTTRPLKTQTASSSEPTMTRSAALKAPAKRRQAALLPRSAAKSARKRAQELSETPAKRTRTSLTK